jgi:hypothetical protein
MRYAWTSSAAKPAPVSAGSSCALSAATSWLIDVRVAAASEMVSAVPLTMTVNWIVPVVVPLSEVGAVRSPSSWYAALVNPPGTSARTLRSSVAACWSASSVSVIGADVRLSRPPPASTLTGDANWTSTVSPVPGTAPTAKVIRFEVLSNVNVTLYAVKPAPSRAALIAAWSAAASALPVTAALNSDDSVPFAFSSEVPASPPSRTSTARTLPLTFFSAPETISTSRKSRSFFRDASGACAAAALPPLPTAPVDRSCVPDGRTKPTL